MRHANRDFTKKRKKDFKLSEELVIEFESLAPSGKQTAIVEELISQWVVEQKRKVTASAVERAYKNEREE